MRTGIWMAVSGGGQAVPDQLFWPSFDLPGFDLPTRKIYRPSEERSG
jgi:hypothetical protein